MARRLPPVPHNQRVTSTRRVTRGANKPRGARLHDVVAVAAAAASVAATVVESEQLRPIHLLPSLHFR